MANMYWKSINFNSPEELADYVDWVAVENGIDHKTALAAIANAWQATIQWKKITEWDPVDEKVWQQIIPELKPVVWEAWYEAPKSFWETMWDSIVEWIKNDITSYPKRKFWELATGWYFNWEKINTKKLLDDAWVWKKWNKKSEDKSEEKSDVKEDNNWNSNEKSWLLKFGKDATSIEQIETRDRELAKIFNEKWIDDISKVEDFLNHYDTFKEASSENKQKTIKRIYDNIKNLQKEEETKKKSEWPQWIYIDQEDYKWTPDAKEWLDMYNRYAQVEAEKWDSTKVFKDMMWEAPTSNNTTSIRNKLKDAWLSTAQINDFTQAWADAYYKVDNDSPINDVKENRIPSPISLKKAKKNETENNSTNTNKWKKLNIVKWSETIKNLLKSKK